MKQCAYFDESGGFGFSFDKPNVSTHFTISAIVFADTVISEIEQLAESVSQKYFNGSEIKSSNVGDNDQRRLDILKVALQGSFFVYAMVFDKRKMFGQGLHQKRSFIKFLNSKAYDNLLLTFPNLKLIADEHGSKEFMDGFRIYLERKYSRKDLFGETEFGFESSKSNRLLQLSDFFVGSIARYYDETTLSPRRQEIMSLLFKSGKLLPVFEWPSRSIPFSPIDPTNSIDKHDDAILNLSIKNAEKFIEDNKFKKRELSS